MSRLPPPDYSPDPATRAAIEAVMQREPELLSNGFGLGGLGGKTPAERDASARESRERLLTTVTQREFEACCAFIDAVGTRKTVVTGQTSYSWKHLVEEWIGFYVSNGAMLAAALHREVPIRRVRNTPNACLALSDKTLPVGFNGLGHPVSHEKEWARLAEIARQWRAARGISDRRAAE